VSENKSSKPISLSLERIAEVIKYAETYSAPGQQGSLRADMVLALRELLELREAIPTNRLPRLEFGPFCGCCTRNKITLGLDPSTEFSPLRSPDETTEKPIGTQRYRMQASGYVVQQWADPKGDWVKSSDYEALRQRFERACHRVTELESSAVEPTSLLSGFMSDERNGIVPDPNYRTRFKVGERILPTSALYKYYPRAIVTEITTRGFKYRYDEKIQLGPRFGWYQEGESFTDDGWDLAADQSPCPPEKASATPPCVFRTGCQHKDVCIRAEQCESDYAKNLRKTASETASGES
jgi:hypothetical protein